MKWDWGLFLAAVIETGAAIAHEVEHMLAATAAMLDTDHEYRTDRKDMEMAVSHAIESLPGGDDNNWGGGQEDDDKGGGK